MFDSLVAVTDAVGTHRFHGGGSRKGSTASDSAVRTEMADLTSRMKEMQEGMARSKHEAAVMKAALGSGARRGSRRGKGKKKQFGQVASRV